jgi:hypothetical protein
MGHKMKRFKTEYGLDNTCIFSIMIAILIKYLMNTSDVRYDEHNVTICWSDELTRQNADKMRMRRSNGDQ